MELTQMGQFGDKVFEQGDIIKIETNDDIQVGRFLGFTKTFFDVKKIIICPHYNKEHDFVEYPIKIKEIVKITKLK